MNKQQIKPAPHISVLHIDDEPYFLEIAKTYLTTLNSNICVTSIDSPSKALELLKNHSYDVIISDYEMPEMNGLELLDNIKSRGYDIPFIILTGKSREEIAIQALNLGAQFYIQKIPSTKVLFRELIHFINKAHQLHIERLEKEQIKKNLIESEKLYSRLFTKANIGMLHCTSKGDILDYNEKAVELFGLKHEELITKNILDLFEEEHKSNIEKAIENLAQQNEVIAEAKIKHPKQPFYVELLFNRLVIDHETSFQVLIRDISEMRSKINGYSSRLNELNLLFPALIDNLSLRIQELVNKLHEVGYEVKSSKYYLYLLKHTVLSEIQEANTLINSFRIAFTRHQQMEQTKVELVALVKKAIDILNDIYPDSKIQFNLENEETEHYIKGDHDIKYLLFYTFHMLFKSNMNSADVIIVKVKRINDKKKS